MENHNRRVLGRIRHALAALRPRAAAQLQKTVSDLSAHSQQHRSAVKQLQADAAEGRREIRDALAALERDVRALADSHQRDAAATAATLAGLKRDVETVTLRTAQLRAIAAADIAQEDDLAALERLLADPDAIHRHVQEAVARAGVHDAPFPYAVVDDILPKPVFDALVKGLPPAVLFADRPVNHQHLKPPFDLAPRYSRRIWNFMADVMVHDFIRPAVLERLSDGVGSWFRAHFPAVAGNGSLADLTLTSGDGRLLLRRRGYRIPPHRDPKWAVITCLLYLPRPGDDERWGTQIFSVAEDEEARGAKPHWIEAARCTLVDDVPFTPNRLLVFVNAVGAHGAFIPEDAEPADLERYAYQFRIGPDGSTMKRLLATLPDDRRAFWAGKAEADY
jgi:hypothetical protein